MWNAEVAPDKRLSEAVSSAVPGACGAGGAQAARLGTAAPPSQAKL